jgi:8-oxo-dGTP diphosphatase
MARPVGRERSLICAYPGVVRIACVGAIVHDPDGRILLVQRGHPPDQGAWSIPGGRVEPGESDAEALAREVGEETGLRVTVGALLGTVERPGPDGGVYEIRDYAATVVGGELAAGDDAGDVRWVDPTALLALRCSGGLVETLRHWGVLG